MGQPLGWGRRYLMVRPDHYRIDYVINPYMSTQDQPDPELALKQWDSLRQAIVDAAWVRSRCWSSARTRRTWSTR